ncbi:6-bladed beta-propeller [Geoalkalibacter halelectricus]|uniref:6-bladed beta-propeller n=1 Tax=Geoalkalibacter halelectricus TaxID=2847045 RepID=A0ABY5ZPZ8_9BACT|nr:6-bladed beta-propeller [Geoalkalibacter halelectricus]MDO3376958.1 6-bladed beta-propeller [Geoalkalibacter halelectricus]UWZ81181.1 6-bladed beta-propeller [Geoalkalibacter halelectricus]
MMFRFLIPLLSLSALCLALFLGGCGAPVSSLQATQAWPPPSAGPVWPAPPEPERIRFVTAVSGLADLEKESGRTQRALRRLTGEARADVPLVNPFAVAADGKGGVWVSDSGAGVVHFFDLAARRVSHFRQIGDTALAVPSGMAFDPERNRLYVADAQLGRVFFLASSGRFQGELRAPRGFGRPGGIALDALGNVYVTDVLNGVVEIFSPQGVPIRTLGSAHASERRFARPIAVAVGRQGHVAVLDAMNFRVEVFTPEWRPQGLIGGLGDGPGRFARPRGLAFDSQGHLYVADAAFDNIQVFDLAGDLLLHFGGPGAGAGQFCLPAGLAVDAQDRIYAVDACNYRFQVFSYVGPGNGEP